MTTPDCAAEPIFDTIWAAGNVADDEVLKPSTMALPWTQVVAEHVRSFEIPALKTYKLESLTVPDCTRVGLAPVGLISYQRIWAPAPPITVCATQMAVLPTVGSTPETAWSSLPSSVSSVFAVPFWG